MKKRDSHRVLNVLRTGALNFSPRISKIWPISIQLGYTILTARIATLLTLAVTHCPKKVRMHS